MDENELVGADAGEEYESEDMLLAVEGGEDNFETSVLEAKFDTLTNQVTVLTDKVTGCYCMLLILAVLGLRNVFRSIIRKVRGGLEDV